MEKELQAIKGILHTLNIIAAYAVIMFVMKEYKESPAAYNGCGAFMALMLLTSLYYFLSSNVRRV